MFYLLNTFRSAILLYTHDFLEKLLITEGLLVLFESSELEVHTWTLDGHRALKHFPNTPLKLAVTFFIEVVVLLITSSVVNKADLAPMHLQTPLSILNSKAANFFEGAPHTANFVSAVQISLNDLLVNHVTLGILDHE